MSNNVTVGVLGDDKIVRALKQKIEAAQANLEPAALAGAEVVRADASRRAPKNQGDLSENIIKDVAEQNDTAVEVDVGPDKDRFYGLFLEFGVDPHNVTPQARKALKLQNGDLYARAEAGGVRAQPFMRPAFDENIEAITEAVAEVIREALGLDGD